jgi:arabinogalactan endo-1,4-beta-galactosidase
MPSVSSSTTVGSTSGTSSSSSNASGTTSSSQSHASSSSSSSQSSSSSSPVDAGAADGSTPFSAPFFLGADITWTQQDAAGGATYTDTDGTQKDILTLLKGHGFNYIRLRTFVDPTQSAPNPAGGTFTAYSTAGFGNLAHTITFGKQIKAAGMGFLLDFHYSDYWADPGKQIKPASWASDNLAALTTALQSYTTDAIQQLVNAGARPDMVQIGNEITPGMELTPGTAFGPISNWPQLAQLLKAGINGVHAVDPTIKIMLHIDRGGDATSSLAFVKNAMDNGVTIDVFGESCYVAYQGQPTVWQSTFSQLATAYPNLKFVIAEYNTDTSNTSNTAELRNANDVMFNMANHQGLGTFIWEPTHTGAWGAGLFTLSGQKYTATKATIGLYDQMKTAYGL